MGIINKIDITMPAGRKSWNHTINRFIKGIDEFSDAMEKMSGDLRQLGKDPEKQAEMFWGKKDHIGAADDIDIRKKFWGDQKTF